MGDIRILSQHGRYTKFEKVILDVCEFELSGISRSQIVAVVVGLPCESYSHADASNISRGNHHRDHSGLNKPRRNLESCTTRSHMDKRCKAMRDDAMCKNILASYFEDCKLGNDYELIMENPVGTLRHRPFMRGEQIESKVRRKTVDYCSYYASGRAWSILNNKVSERLSAC